ncbi:MAG: hypothetical protein HY303_00880 [Candidatus Wallbacteria bacterium]|nr:hypothetical protein [Candidatus Wallbacteria bacterium]
MPDFVRRALVPSVPVLVFLVCLLFVLSTGPAWMFGDGDTGWHLATGRLIASSGHVPTQDSFSWTARGTPWVAFEWLTDLAYYGLYQWCGYLGPLVFDAASIALAYAFIAQAALDAGCELISTLLVTGWAFYLSSIHWFVRPHVRTWLFLALWYWLLMRHRRERDRLVWLVPASMPIWVNLHGGWPTGLMLLVLFAAAHLDSGSGESAGRAWPARRWALLILATLAASLVNPYGPRLHAEILQQVNATAVQNITQEWQSPDFRGNARAFRPFLLGVLASMPFLPVPLQPLGWFLLLLSLHMVFESIRHLTVFLIWMTPIALLGIKGALERFSGLVPRAGAWLARLLELERRAGSRLRGVSGAIWPIAALALAVAGAFPPSLRSGPAGFPADRFPEAAAEYLKVHPPQGRMVN